MSNLLAWEAFLYSLSLLDFVCWAQAPLLTFRFVFWIPPGSPTVSEVIGSGITWHGEQEVIKRSVYSWGQYLISTQRNFYCSFSSSSIFFFTEGTCHVSRLYESAGLKDGSLKGNLQWAWLKRLHQRLPSVSHLGLWLQRWNLNVQSFKWPLLAAKCTILYLLRLSQHPFSSRFVSFVSFGPLRFPDLGLRLPPG